MPYINLHEARVSSERRQQRYYKVHSCCPECGNNELSQTYVAYIYSGIVFRDENKAGCGCGWKGVVHDLVRSK